MDEKFYRFNRFVRQQVPIATTCFRCELESPYIMVPYGDWEKIQDEAADKFAKLGWLMEPHRFKSYCPACKSQGQ